MGNKGKRDLENIIEDVYEKEMEGMATFVSQKCRAKNCCRFEYKN